MKVLHYCQHVLGLGHLARSLAIDAALAPHQVLLTAGGPETGMALPDNVRLVQLPPLEMDAAFQNFHASDGSDLDAVREQRRELLFELMDRERPDIVLIELYPFGRKKFRFELEPLLAACKAGRWGSVPVACSLRDILVEREDQAKAEERALKSLNAHFAALLVHSDRAFQPLEQTFTRFCEIRVPIYYTGYVTRLPTPGARQRLRHELGLGTDEPLVVASAGGGRVGGELLEATVQAVEYTGPTPRLVVFTGPFMEPEGVARLEDLARGNPRVEIRRFSDRFPDWLAAADASVSLAGYNTTMNLLAAGVPALVWPFRANQEQALRAEKLQDLGALEVLSNLKPETVADRLTGLLARGRTNGPSPVAIDGARQTARLLEGLARGELPEDRL